MEADCDGLHHIHPSAGQRPSPVIFFYQQNLIILENSCAGIELGRLKPRLIAKQIFYLCQRKPALQAYYLGGNFPDTLKPLLVKGVFCISQSRLRNELKFFGPFQPLVFLLLFIHIFI